MKNRLYNILVIIMVLQIFYFTANSQSIQYYDSLRYHSHLKKDFDSAIIYAYKAVEMSDDIFGEFAPITADKILMLAFMISESGDDLTAAEYLKKELVIREHNINEQPEKHLDCLKNIASLYYADDLKTSVIYYDEFLIFFEKLYGKDNEDYALYRNMIALIHQNLNDFEKAGEYYADALSLIISSVGKDQRSYGVIANNYARMLYNTGQYDKALPMYLEALENFGKTEGKDSYNYGIALDNIGNLYQVIGQYDEAMRYFELASQNFEVSVGKEHFSYAISLSNRGNLYKILKNYNSSIPLLTQALEVTEKSLGKDHHQYGTFQNNLAAVHHDMGDYEKALGLYESALANAEKSLGKQHYYYGIRLNNLANLYEALHRYNEALILYLEAKEINEQTLGKENPYYSVSLINLGRIYSLLGQTEKSLGIYRETFENNFSSITRNFSYLSEKEKENFVTSISGNLNVLQSFFADYYSKDHTAGEDSYNIQLATKGMILQSGIQMRKAIENSEDEVLIQKYYDWQNLRKVLAEQYSLPESQRMDNIIEIERNANKIEGDLTRLSSEFRQTASLGTVKWQEIKNSLSDNEYAVEFAVYNQDGINKYIAIVLNSKSEHPELVKLFDQTQFDEILAHSSNVSLINNIYRGVILFGQTTDKQVDYSTKLYELIWKPLEKLIPELAIVYFSPSGSLHQISFAAIADENAIRLSDKYKLIQLSTTAVITQKTEFSDKLPKQIALFGGINYDLEPEKLLSIASNINTQADNVDSHFPKDLIRGGSSWNYLPGTLDEVNQIYNTALINNVSPQLYSDENALEDIFKGLSGKKSPDIIHIATHGFFFPDVEKNSDEDFASQSGEMIYRASQNPLNRAGLLFTGANNAWTGNKATNQTEDGILTAYEVSNLSFGKTQLVVLSACETGLGEIKGSEGVFGLQRAFKAAGAEYLLMSLWKVPDAETAEFMVYFYDKLFSGNSILDSFHNTQEYMKEKYPDEPYKWAAFVLLR